ncbi:MAG: hypothetical protein M1836_005057 [Candelina mexicana]|nr:MAG: hypothetical protein M1836_005057 [Candelina mexicana]
MATFENRLASFTTKWPHERLLPAGMAAAGFYHMPTASSDWVAYPSLSTPTDRKTAPGSTEWYPTSTCLRPRQPQRLQKLTLGLFAVASSSPNPRILRRSTRLPQSSHKYLLPLPAIAALSNSAPTPPATSTRKPASPRPPSESSGDSTNPKTPFTAAAKQALRKTTGLLGYQHEYWPIRVIADYDSTYGTQVAPNDNSCRRKRPPSFHPRLEVESYASGTSTSSPTTFATPPAANLTPTAPPITKYRPLKPPRRQKQPPSDNPAKVVLMKVNWR